MEAILQPAQTQQVGPTLADSDTTDSSEADTQSSQSKCLHQEKQFRGPRHQQSAGCP
jgi:hypothetical protein